MGLKAFASPMIDFFSGGGTKPDTDAKQLEYQEALCKKPFDCKSNVETLTIPSDAGRNSDTFYAFCADLLKERPDIPVRMVSLGQPRKTNCANEMLEGVM